MKRPVAASAAAEAAEKAPQERPIHARRVSRGDVSSGSRPAAAAAGLAAFAAAPPAEAGVVVFPARSGIGAAGGLGATGRAAGAAWGVAAGLAPVAGTLATPGF